MSWEVKNAEWWLREEKDGTLTLLSSDGKQEIKGLTWSQVRALNAISAEADREFARRR